MSSSTIDRKPSSTPGNQVGSGDASIPEGKPVPSADDQKGTSKPSAKAPAPTGESPDVKGPQREPYWFEKAEALVAGQKTDWVAACCSTIENYRNGPLELGYVFWKAHGRTNTEQEATITVARAKRRLDKSTVGRLRKCAMIAWEIRHDHPQPLTSHLRILFPILEETETPTKAQLQLAAKVYAAADAEAKTAKKLITVPFLLTAMKAIAKKEPKKREAGGSNPQPPRMPKGAVEKAQLVMGCLSDLDPTGIPAHVVNAIETARGHLEGMLKQFS